MGDDVIHRMCWRTVLLMLATTLVGFKSDGASLCPAGCRCENDVLKTSCASASLQVVPIQLNPELRVLDLSSNKILHIHFSFEFYENLVSLNLSDNRIKTLGNSNFNSQKNLTYLDVSNNQIENITKDSLKGLKVLTHLDVSNNTLQDINSMAFRDLHSLAVLKLNSNKLVHLEEQMFKNNRELRKLYLSDNQFLRIPTVALTDALHLHFLTMSRNLLLSIEANEMPNLPELHTLHMDSNIISEIHPDGLSGLPVLGYLDICDNNLTSLPTESLAKLSSLNMLKLSGNFIESIPPVAFKGLFHLKTLKIDRLELLEEIDVRAFVDNINLEKVNMDFNVKVRTLPTRLFHSNSKLRYISVRYNSLENLDATHFPLDQLSELKIGGNPLQCNCSLGWLWQIIKESKSKTLNQTDNLILDENDIICSGPEELRGAMLSTASSTQMSCSVGWIATISVIVTVIFVLIVIGGVLYWAPKHKPRRTKSDLSVEQNPVPQCSSSKRSPFEPVQVEKYIIPPPMVHDYRSLHSWDPYEESSINIYEPLNDHCDRPHIVYV
ncbi:unnamed protein product [Acanthoscelides obtectus]|uniref:LRRCT domain-containing protein n=1 Tax=Acanthoscelides obtectus TaxID=200917 RepID=A0A9P0LIL0_ACAOB|nr:unnamed protein product [Acanthoscelides obtectus]CAK1621696.1 Insulin-like growth factor-binding protein complex acid labile subunit [Acanthoscelides obtectus]